MVWLRVHSRRPGPWGLAKILLTGLVPFLLLPVGPPSPSHAPPSALPTSPGSIRPVLSLGPGPSVSPRPAAVTLSDAGATPAAVDLQWTPTAPLVWSNYTVFESSNGTGGPWRVAGVVTTQNSPSLVVASLTPGGEYWWEVVSYAVIGTTEYSNILDLRQPTLSYLNVTQPLATVADLNWTNNASYGGSLVFGSYAIYEAVLPGGPTRVATITNVSQLTYNVTGLASSSSYSFYVNTSDCISACGTGTAGYSVTQSNSVTAGTPQPLVASIGAERIVLDVGVLDYLSCTPAGGHSPYTFTWNFGNGTYVPGPSGLSHSWSSAGSTPVTCRIRDALASNSSAATTLTINPALVVNASVNRTASDVGQSVGFTCTSTGGTAPSLLSWGFGDGAGAALGNTSYSYPRAGQFLASCSAVDFGGGSDLAAASVSVSELPKAQLNASTPAAAPNTSVHFTLTFSNGSAPFTGLQVNFGDGTVASGPIVSHAYHQAGNYTVAGRAKDSNGAVARTTLVVHVVALELQLTVPSGSLHSGTSYGFQATPSGGAGGPFTVNWSFGDGSRSTGANPTHSFAKAGSFLVTVTATDRLGASVSRNLSATVTVPPVPPTPGWLLYWLLVPATVVGFGVLLIAGAIYRRRESRALSGAAQYVLPTDPERTITGVRKCRNCGTTNSAVRETCGTCGATLPRSIFG